MRIWPRKLNARISLLLLGVGLILIASNHYRSSHWILDRRLQRIEEEMFSMGSRLAGVMQRLVRLNLSAEGELEMSYAAAVPMLELGFVCDSAGRIRHTTSLQWPNTELQNSPLRDVQTQLEASKVDMTPSVKLDLARSRMVGVFPFFEKYHSRDRGSVALSFDLTEAVSEISRDVWNESVAQACGLGAVCLLLWLGLDWMVMRRLKILAEYAQRMGSGGGIESGQLAGDELSMVASNFEMAIKQLHSSEARLLEAAETERRRIGSDLHDDVCQRITAAQLKAGVLKLALDKEMHPQSAMAGAVAEELSLAAKVARGFARGMAPMLVRKGHLEDSLREMCGSVERSFGVTCKLQMTQVDPPLALWVDTHLYRIIQELVTNAAKHAQATAISVKLATGQKEVALTVENDGIPFSLNADSGIGLELVSQRVRALGGQWSIQPRDIPPGGSICSCQITLAARHFQDEQNPEV